MTNSQEIEKREKHVKAHHGEVTYKIKTIGNFPRQQPCLQQIYYRKREQETET